MVVVDIFKVWMWSSDDGSDDDNIVLEEMDFIIVEGMINMELLDVDVDRRGDFH